MLEAHYKVIFKQVDEVANSFEITDFIVDVVYGELTEACDVVHTFNLKTSVNYYESETGWRYSGNPGYLRGSPLLIGKTEDVFLTNELGSTTS